MATSVERREYYERLATKSAAPLWESLSRLIPSEPRPTCVPAVWRYEEIRPLLLEAGSLITEKEAERRVLMLENPGMGGRSQITGSLYAGLQLVLPGELTSTHRHMTSALRFVIEGTGAYTAVDGERTTLHPGDFVLTPSWTYHNHGNPSNEPVVSLEGLDLQIVNMFDTSFAEGHPDGAQTVTRMDGDAPVPFNFPYSRSRAALEQLYRNGPVDECHGVKMQYSNPATGGYPMPTIGAVLQLLPSGFRGRGYRSTDSTVYCVAEGRGRSRIGDTTIDWREHDVFVVPSWHTVSHEVQSEAVLFSFSDRPVQKVLGLWREEIGA
jgi:gentisate 1,2-dioxygenase